MPSEILKGIKHDQGKIDWSLVPWKQFFGVAAAMTLGAKKYAPYNWKNVLKEENGRDRYFAAAMRHIIDWKLGKRVDESTGLHPLHHAICNLLIEIWGDEHIPAKSKVTELTKQITEAAQKVKNLPEITVKPSPVGAIMKRPTINTISKKKNNVQRKKGR